MKGPRHMVAGVAASDALGPLELLTRQVGVLGPALVDEGLFDRDDADALRGIVRELLARAREVARIPIQAAHAARVDAGGRDPAAPVEVQDEAVDGEVVVAQRGELVIDLVPVVEAEFRHPEIEHLLRRPG